MKILWTIVSLSISLLIHGQVNNITKLDHKELLKEFGADYDLNNQYEENRFSLKLIEDGEKLHAFFYSKEGFIKCTSFDNGITWIDKKLIHVFDYDSDTYLRYRFDVAYNSDGSYLVFAQPFEDGSIFKLGPLAIWKFSHDDQLVFRSDLPVSRKDYFDLCRVSDQEYYLSYYDKDYSPSPSSVIYHSIDGGQNWELYSVLENIETLSLEYSPLDQKVKGTFSHAINNQYNIMFSENALVQDILANSKSIGTSDHYFPFPKLVGTNDNKLWVIFNERFNQNNQYKQSDVVYSISEDNGNNWTQPISFSKYLGDDILMSASRGNNYPLINIISNRDTNQQNSFYFGHAGYSKDNAPPFFQRFYDPEMVEDNSFTLRTKVFDDEEIESVFIEKDNIKIQLFDDGNHNDSLANDNIYGKTVPEINRFSSSTVARVGVNNVKMPINNKGIIGDINLGIRINYKATDISNNQTQVSVGQRTYGSLVKYLGKGIIFSGGFFLSGYKNDELFANAMASASLVEDYQAGNVGSSPDYPKNKIYTTTKDDPPFGEAWQEWRYAVQQGAYFYDGNGNGIYDPVDANGNGIWEENEDRPDLLYDATYFTVYNDNVPRMYRRFDTVEPQGIEIRQTIFASGSVPELQDAIFIRYSILYKGRNEQPEPDTLNDVIFSVWNDVDIGNAIDDLVGCDTTLQSSVTYNDGPDEAFNPVYVWNENPPAIFRTILQGPPIKSSNQNDIAYNRMGQALGEITIKGWRNEGMASYRHYLGGISSLDAPIDAEIARNQMLGLDNFGEVLDPCDWAFGEIRGSVNCEDINPYFWYSGDPTKDHGWICTVSADQRDLVNTEKFTLVKDEPVDIIVAYTVGHGSDPLSSITDGRNKVRKLFEIYEQNFPGSYTPPNYEEIYPKQFSLSQNYPNPFNPSTKIKYTIPSNSLPSPYQGEGVRVRLVIYNILGQQVEVLLNEPKAPGTYEVTFNASQLASGVYFYRLTAGDFVQTKKMMVLK